VQGKKFQIKNNEWVCIALEIVGMVSDGRRPNSGPTTRSMARKIPKYWDSGTDARDTLLYRFKNVIT